MARKREQQRVFGHWEPDKRRKGFDDAPPKRRASFEPPPESALTFRSAHLTPSPVAPAPPADPQRTRSKQPARPKPPAHRATDPPPAGAARPKRTPADDALRARLELIALRRAGRERLRAPGLPMGPTADAEGVPMRSALQSIADQRLAEPDVGEFGAKDEDEQTWARVVELATVALSQPQQEDSAR